MTKDRASLWVGVSMLDGVRSPNNEEVRTLDAAFRNSRPTEFVDKQGTTWRRAER